MILRIKDFELRGPHRLWLSFSDGSEGVANLLPLLEHGKVFEPLRNPSLFAEAALDPVAGTIVWPNGADFAPEALHALLESVPASA